MYIQITDAGHTYFLEESEILAVTFSHESKESFIHFKSSALILKVSFESYDKKQRWDMIPKNTEVALKSYD
jgi:hypothetical protein